MSEETTLTEREWELFVEAERSLYANGPLAFSDVLCREDSERLVPLWYDARACAEATWHAGLGEPTDDAIEREAARRVAVAQFVIVTGEAPAPAPALVAFDVYRSMVDTPVARGVLASSDNEALDSWARSVGIPEMAYHVDRLGDGPARLHHGTRRYFARQAEVV